MKHRLLICALILAIGCMGKPQMKNECAVAEVNTKWNWISFYAPVDKAKVFAEFGRLDPNQISPERFTLSVDTRYDIEEVADYINNC